MRGFLLSLDALVASGLLMLLAVFIAGFSLGVSSDELQVKKVYYVGKDIHNVLFEATIADVREFPIVQDYFNEGILTEEEVNLTLIELIGYWWAIGNTSQATNLTKEIIDAMVNQTIFGYEILFDNTSIYRRDVPQTKFITKTTSIISGFELGKQPEGFVASAFVKGLKKNTTLTLPLNPEGSAVEEGEKATITKRFFLNSTEIVAIGNATLYLSIHYGIQALSSQKFRVNGGTIDNDIIWIYEHLVKEIDGQTTHLSFGIADLNGLLNLGVWNTIEAELSGDPSAWHSHIHPGFRLEMELQKNVSSLPFSSVENTTFYFDDIVSEATADKKSGAWAILPFFIPQGAEVREVTLFVHGKDINNISTEGPDGIPDTVPNKYNVQIYLNNITIDLTNPETQDENEELNVTLSYNLTGNVTEGTSVVSVYLNAYGDEFWGRDDTILYSDPENDPAGSSSLRVEYVKPPNEQRFGQIQVGVREGLGGVNENPKVYNKSFNGSELFRTFLHLAQLDSDQVTVNVSISGPPQTAFETPRPFATPTTIFIDPQLLSETENNTINISDVCTVLCDILPESSYEYFIWLASLVGYGQVFPNSSAATEDALDRLNALLGQYAEITEFVNDTQSIPGIPSLWGPAKMEVRVWL